MIKLPVTDLRLISFDKEHPHIFLKYESHLPFGGGNKVRRFLNWLEENKDAKEINIASDIGSHSFYVLSRILHDAQYKDLKATFWERNNESHLPYRAKLRNQYLQMKNVQVRTYSIKFFALWLFNVLMNNKQQIFSLGGNIKVKTNSYKKTMSECIFQLKEYEIFKNTVWHLFPIASGRMADDFLTYLKKKNIHNHRIIGLLTGSNIVKPYLKTKYCLNKKITLVETKPITWNQYLECANHFHDKYQIFLDPIHTCHLYQFLQNIPSWISKKDVIVVWLTEPLISSLP